MLEKYTNPTHILFSDEAWFHLRRYVNSYYSNRSRNANLHTDSASLRLVHGVEQVQLLLLSTFFSSDHKFISIFLTPFFENPSVCKRTYTSFQHDSATAHTGNSFMLFTQCLWWQNSEKRIVASLSAWSESIKLSARHWRWSEKKKNSACVVHHQIFSAQGTCYSDVMHVCEPNETTSSTFFKMVSTKSSSTYNALNHTTHGPWPAADWQSDCCTNWWHMKLST